jgi:hypothetical protein
MNLSSRIIDFLQWHDCRVLISYNSIQLRVCTLDNSIKILAQVES